MDNTTEILYSIGPIIGGFSSLIILTATIILFIKKKTPATRLILIGYILVFITDIVGLILTIVAGLESIETLILTQSISAIVRSLSYLIFAIGLIMLAVTEFTKIKSLK